MKKVNLQNIIEKNSEDKLRNNSKKVSSTLPDDSWLAKYKRGGGYFPKYHSFTAPRMDIGGKIGGEKETEPTATTNLPTDYRARWNNLQSYIRDQVGYDDANPIAAQPKVRGFNETRTYVDQYNKLNPNTPFNTDWISHIENELTGQIIPDKTRMAEKFGLEQKQPIVGGNRNIIGYRMLGQTYRYPDMKLVTSQGSKDLGIPGANYQIDAGSGYLGQDLSNTGAGANMAGLIPGKVYIDGKTVDVKVSEGKGYIMKPNGDVLMYDPVRYDAITGRYRQFGGDISIPNLSKNTWITKYKDGGSLDKFIPKYDKGGKPCPQYYIRDPYTEECIPDPTVDQYNNAEYEYSIDLESKKNKSNIDKNNVVIDYVDPKTGKVKHKKIRRNSTLYRNLVDAKVLTGMTVDDKGQVHTEFNTSDKTPADVKELQEIVIYGTDVPMKEGSLGKYTREFRRENNFKKFIQEKVEKEKSEAQSKGIGWNESFNDGAIERATQEYYRQMNNYAARGLRKFNKREEGQDVADWLDEFSPRQRAVIFSESGSEDLYKTYMQDAAERTRNKVMAGDENATFTFPDSYDAVTGKKIPGETKAWKDMTFNERNYVSGENLSGWGQFNKEEDGEILPYLNYINPFTVIPALAGQMAQVPYRTVKENSPLPALSFGVNAFVAGKLGSLKTFNPLNRNFYTKANFTHKPTTFEFANNIFTGIPALSKGAYKFSKEFVEGSIKNKALTLPKFNPFVRLEPSNFSLSLAQDAGRKAGVLSEAQIVGTTGKFFTWKNPVKEIYPYLYGNERKTLDPNARFNILGDPAVPQSKMSSLVETTNKGHYLTPEAETMSFGLGDHATWKDVQKAHPEFTDAEIAILEKSFDPKLRESLTADEIPFLTQAQNKARTYPDLINKTEAVANTKVAEGFRNVPYASNLTAKEAADMLLQFDNPFKQAILYPMVGPLKKGFRGFGSHGYNSSPGIERNNNSENLKKGGSTSWLDKYKQV